MHQVGALHVQQSAQHLVHNELDVNGRPARHTLVVLDDAAQVPPAVLLHHPNIAEAGRGRRQDVPAPHPANVHVSAANTACQNMHRGTHLILPMLGWLHCRRMDSSRSVRFASTVVLNTRSMHLIATLDTHGTTPGAAKGRRRVSQGSRTRRRARAHFSLFVRSTASYTVP